MDCLLRGLSNKCIAGELKIAEGTVKVYLKLLSRRIKAGNRTQLAVWALRQSELHRCPSEVTPVVSGHGDHKRCRQRIQGTAHHSG
jgi:hypothetical protein